MTQLNLSYSELENMPLEFTEWFYKRKLQDLVEEQEARKKGTMPVF